METTLKLSKKGELVIPYEVLREYNYKPDDVFKLVESGGVMHIYKVRSKKEIKDALKHFGESLDKAGYKTKQDILELVKEVKEELAAEN